ncbi:hypothetical protein AAHH87_00690 [Candidatus Hodgkinia cicadicola]
MSYRLGVKRVSVDVCGLKAWMSAGALPTKPVLKLLASTSLL